MARLKPRAIGINLLPKPKFAAPQNRFPVQIATGAAAQPGATPPFDPSLDQVLGKYR